MERSDTLGRRARYLVTGAAGTIGRLLISGLDSDVVALDIEPPPEPQSSAKWVVGSVSDRRVVDLACSDPLDGIVHLATGAPDWEGLLSVDIIGLKNLLDVAVEREIPKVVYASSNHVVGMVEREVQAGLAGVAPYSVSSVPRPDSLYGVAKASGEALCRLYAETTTVKTSSVRIGTVRESDSIEDCAHEPYFRYVGDLPAIRERLARTWLSHEDLVAAFLEELTSDDSFRLRFGFSGHEDPYWTSDVLVWNRADAGR